MAVSRYRLQVFLSDEVHEDLRDAAHEDRTSIQKLVEGWLVENLAERRKQPKIRGKHAPKSNPPD